MIERRQAHAAVTAFLALFSIVGIALYGLPFFYDFFVRDLGWTRAQVTSGNALSKVIVGPLFGFAAGWIVDRFGPRRLMLAGIVMAGAALVGLGSVTTLGFFYACYMLNALGNVCGGPLPNQVLLARWFDRNRGKAMGFAYLGIGIGGTLVPLIATALITRVRVAHRAAGPRHPDGGHRVPGGLVREGLAGAWNDARGSRDGPRASHGGQPRRRASHSSSSRRRSTCCWWARCARLRPSAGRCRT